MINLDMKCAEYAQIMINEKMGTIATSKTKESTIQKALGVLFENGPYAMFIFCESKKGKKDKEGFAGVNQGVNDLFGHEDIKIGSGGTLGDKLKSIADNLDMLLFARDLMERTLTYARYHAKAQD
jgi:uncharacterized protein YbbC (DUF1343 family)